MTNPIQNLVPNVAISVEALKVLDSNQDEKVTLEELNQGIASETVQFNAQGKIVPKPIALMDPQPTPPVAAKAEPDVKPETPAVAPAAKAAAPNARTKVVLALVEDAAKRVDDKHTAPQNLHTLETALIQINREIQNTKPPFSPNIRETAAMTVMSLLQNKAMGNPAAETVIEGMAGLNKLRGLLKDQ